ncbi:MAG: cytochrome c [Actinomycetota bacterium]|nr:cytochrome c [Actinomycetota bacterium]
MIAAIWKNDLRHWLIWINFVAFGGLIVYIVRSVLSPKRARREEKTPANLTPFLEDEVLESRRLERVQGWSLIFAAVFAIALPLYWLREPTRQHQTVSYFDKNSVARGAVLFANSASPEYDAAVSLQCANCHGQKGVGGVAPTTVNGVKVNWKVPPLNTEALRFEEDTDCLSQSRRQPNTICDLTDIITYGRPGTPMQPWGVVGGGPKNDQSIADLVTYIESIQVTKEASQAAVTKALATARSNNAADTCPEFMTCPGIELANARKTLATAKTDLDAKRKALQKALNALAANDAELTAQCTTIQKKADAAETPLTGSALAQAVACGDYLTSSATVETDQAAVSWSTEWQKRRANVSQGQLLFEMNCARCHTEGWSAFDPAVPPGGVNSVDILGLSGGGGGNGGGIGFNLRDGDEMRRFGSDTDGGFAAQVDFVSNGSAPFKPYGNLGLGSGKMPGFGQIKTLVSPYLGAMLTPKQIAEIVYYERYCMDSTTYTAVTPVCATRTTSKSPPTTTTTVKKG